MAVADKPEVELTLLRDQAEVAISVPTVPIDGVGTDRVLVRSRRRLAVWWRQNGSQSAAHWLHSGVLFVQVWAGLLLQKPYRQIREMGPVASEVYVSYYLAGSPASFTA